MHINKAEFGRYTIELFIVMIGVFLGILVSDWNANRNHEILKQTLLSNMLVELETNSEYLNNAYEYHSHTFNKLDSLWKVTGKTTLNKRFFEGHGFQQIPNWKGVGIPVLKKSSYESAVISNIFPYMNPKTLEQITDVYSQIANYNAVREKIINRMYNINSDTKLIDVLLIIEIIRGDVKGFEYNLSKSCQRTIEIIKQHQ